MLRTKLLHKALESLRRSRLWHRGQRPRKLLRSAALLRGAGLDVYPDEPDVDARLIAHPNVMTLPHIGSATREGREDSGLKVIANIRMWADGHRPPDQVLTGF